MVTEEENEDLNRCLVIPLKQLPYKSRIFYSAKIYNRIIKSQYNIY
jgi:hypothetical protein